MTIAIADGDNTPLDNFLKNSLKSKWEVCILL
jgi:hypothetical protein